MEEKIVIVLNEMSEYLSIAQMKKLQEVIIKTFAENEPEKTKISNSDFLEMFLASKRVEGCSDRTIQYYRVTVAHMFTQIDTEVRKITTEEIRAYLANYQKRNNCSNVTIDNVRRNPHKFRRTMATRAIDKGMPIEQVQKILGHSQIDTTMQYAMVNQSNVKTSHQKYMA